MKLKTWKYTFLSNLFSQKFFWEKMFLILSWVMKTNAKTESQRNPEDDTFTTMDCKSCPNLSLSSVFITNRKRLVNNPGPTEIRHTVMWEETLWRLFINLPGSSFGFCDSTVKNWERVQKRNRIWIPKSEGGTFSTIWYNRLWKHTDALLKKFYLKIPVS